MLQLKDNADMVKSVEGIYRNGVVELLQPVSEVEGARVIVTWLPPDDFVDLRAHGIHEEQAADLRHRLLPFTEDWDRPEMSAYDQLSTR